jgi:hypothetical protein
MNNKLVKNLATSFCKVDVEVIEKKLLKRGRLAEKDRVIGKQPVKGTKNVDTSKVAGKASSSADVCAQQMKKKTFKLFPNDKTQK